MREHRLGCTGTHTGLVVEVVEVVGHTELEQLVCNMVEHNGPIALWAKF